MVGGLIETVTPDPEKDRFRVMCVDTPYKRPQYCSVFVANENGASWMRPGDKGWWGAGNFYWTPRVQSGIPEHHLKRGCFCSKERFYYDIPLRKIGYSF